MTIYEKIIAVYPELENSSVFDRSIIHLQNDGDGAGDYIAKWEYSKPLPEGMKVGKN
jgi:hypothetical protein